MGGKVLLPRAPLVLLVLVFGSFGGVDAASGPGKKMAQNCIIFQKWENSRFQNVTLLNEIAILRIHAVACKRLSQELGYTNRLFC